MNYRKLGKTGLSVSEIGLGGEWLERHSTEEVKKVIDRCEEQGINILDCWMPNPKVREDIGKAISGKREKWIIQGHLGSTWQDGQYVRTRDMAETKKAFGELLKLLGTDYIDLGMIHYIDEMAEFNRVFSGEFLEYAKELKKSGTIRHIGMSTHNPEVAKAAAESKEVELILFSINPAFDMLPPSEDINVMFNVDTYNDLTLGGISKERDLLYRTCEKEGVALTVMKGYAGGRLLSADTSPFKVALSPVQCLHYALTRPAVASVMVGCDTPEHVDAAVAYESATEEEKNYSDILAKAPRHAYAGQCTYCGHCAPCPSQIDIAMVNKLYDLATLSNEIPQSVRGHYEALSANASDCIGCGSCEERCPFGVKVTQRMEDCSKLFG